MAWERGNELGVIIFGSVRFLSKKVTKKNFKMKNSNRNQTGTGSYRPVSVRLILHKNRKT